jgi:hypothetical protein
MRRRFGEAKVGANALRPLSHQNATRNPARPLTMELSSDSAVYPGHLDQAARVRP